MFRIEQDAQLLANRIALLKQEEMKTWKKIEEAKKRTGEIQTLKKRNEDKVQKVGIRKGYLYGIENCRFASEYRVAEDEFADELRDLKAEAGWEEEDLGGDIPVKARRG